MSLQTSPAARHAAIPIGGHVRHPRDKIVPRKFGAVAKVLWRKPAAEIAFIAGVNIRTAKRILRGESDIPVEVLIAANAEMVRRHSP